MFENARSMADRTAGSSELPAASPGSSEAGTTVDASRTLSNFSVKSRTAASPFSRTAARIGLTRDKISSVFIIGLWIRLFRSEREDGNVPTLIEIGAFKSFTSSTCFTSGVGVFINAGFVFPGLLDTLRARESSCASTISNETPLETHRARAKNIRSAVSQATSSWLSASQSSCASSRISKGLAIE
jgi:hypothetical protein